MCCFSGPVREVSRTRIFARATAGGRQVLAYSMTIAADADVAMILPLPTPLGVADDAVRFVDLSGYADLFGALDAVFPVPLAAPAAAPVSRSFQPQALVVHEVGDFVASFVPSLPDFDRLDARFRLPPAVWDQRPEYAESSFAVFQLRHPAGSVAGDAPSIFDRVLRRSPAPHGVRATIHPMAFELPRRDPGRLFFPTVHVHDGFFSETADFDHQLYWQGAPLLAPHDDWAVDEAAAADVAAVVDTDRACGLLDPAQGLRRWSISGSRPNTDTYVDDPPAPEVDAA